ncbi:MAG TPA: M28 family peptidase [bacterium]|nr:M28 family peptidase [bacterium]
MRRAVIVATISAAAGGAAFAGPTLVAVELARPADAYALLARGVAVVEARPTFALVLGSPEGLGALDGYRCADLGEPPGPVYIAWPRPGEPLAEVPGVAVLAVFDDAYVVSGEPAAVERLAAAGAELKRVGLEPLKAPRRAAYEPISYEPWIAQLLSRVRADRYYGYVEELAAFKTRYSHAAEIGAATDYIEENFRRRGFETARRAYVYEPMDNDYLVDCAFRADGELGWMTSYWGYVWRSVDAGKTWRAVKSEGRLEDGAFVTDKKGFVVGGKGFLARTDDGGLTWRQLPLEDPDDYLRDVAFRGTQLGVAAGDGGAAYRTVDGGANWSKVASPTQKLIYGVYPQAADRWWAVGEDGLVMRSGDGGVSWEKRYVIPTEGFTMRDIAFADATHAVMVGYEGTILYSRDAGETWRRVSGYFPEWPFFTFVGFADATRGWAGGSNGKVYRTDDAGASWTRQPTPFGEYYTYNALSIISRDEAWIVGGPSAIIHTADGGAHWEAVKVENAEPITWYNVEGTLRGVSHPERVVVLCGHYDSISEDPWNLAPGAEDNASGTAALLEAATALAGFEFDGTIKLVAFSGEEEGLLGSKAYVRDEHRAGSDIYAAFNMDMISYLDEPVYDVEVRYNDFSSELLSLYRDAARLYVPGCVIYPVTEGRGGSDHESFWDFGYPALLSIEYAGKEFYPWYHTTQDLSEHLTPAFGADVTRVNLAAAASLAGARGGPGGATGVIAYPNPARPSAGHAGVNFANLPPGGTLAVYDLAGTRVWSTAVGASAAAYWPLTARDGSPAASGVYLFVVEGSTRATGKVALIR